MADRPFLSIDDILREPKYTRPRRESHPHLQHRRSCEGPASPLRRSHDVSASPLPGCQDGQVSPMGHYFDGPVPALKRKTDVAATSLRRSLDGSAHPSRRCQDGQASPMGQTFGGQGSPLRGKDDVVTTSLRRGMDGSVSPFRRKLDAASTCLRRNYDGSVSPFLPRHDVTTTFPRRSLVQGPLSPSRQHLNGAPSPLRRSLDMMPVKEMRLEMGYPQPRQPTHQVCTVCSPVCYRPRSQKTMNPVWHKYYNAYANQFFRYQLLRQPRKRIRASFSHEQVLALQKVFDENKYVGSSERRDLARQLRMTEQQVKIWFQNRRYKEKRKEKHDEDVTSQDITLNEATMLNEFDLNNSYHGSIDRSFEDEFHVYPVSDNDDCFDLTK